MQFLNNALQTEILKFKKNKMALIGFAVTISIPIHKTKIDYDRFYASRFSVAY